MTLSEAILAAQSETASPGELSKLRLWLAGRYAYLNGQFTEILVAKPARWNVIRKDTKSDTAAERLWEATDDGKKETELRHELKSIDKLMSAVKTRIDILQGEAHNLY